MDGYEGDEGRTTDQQVQFFRDCLLPRYDVQLAEDDLYEDVDGALTTMENWQRLQDRYSIDRRDTGYDDAWTAMAERFYVDVLQAQDDTADEPLLAAFDRYHELDERSIDELLAT